MSDYSSRRSPPLRATVAVARNGGLLREQKGCGDIFNLFLRYGILLAGAGLAIGAVAAAGLSRSMSGLLVGVASNDLPTYLAAALFFALVAPVASFVPAWRAARVEPMRVLREG